MFLSTFVGLYAVSGLASADSSYGTLDTTFGNAGSTYQNSMLTGEAVAIQSDGKILTAGAAVSDNLLGSTSLTRFNPDGSVDTSFGQSGIASSGYTPNPLSPNNPFPNINQPTAIITQANGNILLIGTGRSTSSDIGIQRYFSNGSLDSSFGNNGTLNIILGQTSLQPLDTKLDSQGRLVISGSAGVPNNSSAHGFIARLNQDGTPDSTFNGTGIVTKQIYSNITTAFYAVSPEPDGSVVTGGATYPSNNQALYQGILVKYSSTGTLDTSFSNSGVLDIGVPNYNYVGALTTDQTGNVYAADSMQPPSSSTLPTKVYKFTSSGAPIQSFGANGVAPLPGSSPFYAKVLRLDAAGDILAAGALQSEAGAYQSAAVARLTPSGSPEIAFGTNGLATGPSGTSNIAWAMTLDASGKIITSGWTQASSTDPQVATVNRFMGGNVDTIPPTITATITPTPNAAGWNGRATVNPVNTGGVTVTFTCSDPGGSGIASCSGPMTVTNETAGQTVTGTAVDNAGNAQTTQVVVKIDKTPPTATGPAMSSTLILFNANVTISANASDTLSGVAGGEYFIDVDPGQGNGATMTYANGKISTTAHITGLSIGVHTLYMRSKDAAGNWSPTVSVNFTFI